MNKRLSKMYERKRALLATSKNLLGVADKADRELTAAERCLYDENLKEVDDLNEAIAEEESQRTVIDHDSLDDFSASIMGEVNKNPLAETTRTVKGKVGAKWSELFPARRGGVQMGASEFFAAIHSGVYHPALQSLNEGTGSAGGYLVPDQVVSDYMGTAYENSLVWPRATIFPMTGETLKVAGFDASSAEEGTLFGGMTWSWIPEEGEGSITDPTMVKRELHARKLGVFARSSNELIEDGLSLQTQLEGAMSQGSGWAGDYSFFNGTGAGEPRGILNDAALVVVDPEAGQVASTIVYENLVKMFARLHPACMNRSAWFVNPTTIPQLLTLTIPIGTGGSHIPVMRETDGGFTILTRPVLLTEKLKSLGTQGDILFADVSQYAIGLRRELTIERSQHIRFMTDETVWRGILRCDGQGLWTSPYTPVNGDTQSWCVVLGDR